MSLLELDRVSRSFGGVHAVKDLSLAAAAGAITGLIGPNGAGKTTAINLIAGLFKLDHGRVVFAGQDISTLEPHLVARAGIARTFQTIRLLPNETVLANILVGFHQRERAASLANLIWTPAAQRRRCELRREASDMLAAFSMVEYAEHPARALSYGHQRRVEIIRALAAKPQLLMLDEPAAGMNDVEADAIGTILKRLARTGLAVLLVEHNMRLVMSTCDLVHVMDTGRLMASGSPREVLQDPRVIASYLGS